IAWGNAIRQYDANGSLASDGLTSYTWNSRHMLASTSGAVNSSFDYDGAARRTSSTAAGTQTQDGLDGLNPALRSIGGQTVDLLSGSTVDEWLGRVDQTDITSYLTDALGSSIALMDGSGQRAAYTMEPFGATRVTGDGSDTLRFNGKDEDETG